MMASRPVTILIAEDDPDDRMLVRDALAQCKLVNTVRFVEDGQELLDYLCRRGRFVDPATSPTAGLVLVDLNMPRMDGRAAIEAIKSNPALRHIPVTVLTTSRADEDVFRSYALGVNSYITKPVSFDGLVRVMQTVGQYWFEIVELPV
jgi:two-component system response regulator